MKPWLNVSEAAEYASLSRDTIYTACERGELRSAHWFASQSASDPWTDYHLAGAAERVEGVSWPVVYPPVKAARAWAGSVVLALSAIALVLTSAGAIGAAVHGAETAGLS